VLERLREGESNAEIAAHLDVSVNTVRTHVSSMLAELDLRDREELGRWLGEPALATRTAPAANSRHSSQGQSAGCTGHWRR